MKKSILLVEDNKTLQGFNKHFLEGKDFLVETAMTLKDAKETLSPGRTMPNAIVLDIGMPDGNGLDFLRDLRTYSDIPVLLLTGLGQSRDIVAGFDSGCNDYLTKPYTPDVLFVRLKCILDRAEKIPEIIKKGAIRLEITPMIAFVNETDANLTPKEFAVLLYLMQREGEILSMDTLYEQVWRQPLNHDKQSLKKTVSRVRSALKNSGFTISTQRNEGYRFEEETPKTACSSQQ